MSKILAYVIYDSKVEAYHKPFFARTKGEALRMWERLSNDLDTEIGRSPGDFTLFETAEFDDQKGVFKSHSALVNLGTALEAKTIDSNPGGLRSAR